MQLLRHGLPRRVLLFGPVSIGDDLLCTAIARELARRGEAKPTMMSRHPTLFAHNADFARVVPVDDYHARLLAKLGTTVTQPYYFQKSADQRSYVPPPHHIIAEMCRRSGLTGEIALRPWLHLTDTERAAGKLHERQLVLHTSGLAAGSAMANKEWLHDRFQAVADALAPRYAVIQLGSASDPLLNGVRDLRGKTSLRESAAIVAAARLVICQVGFLMHLARAVDTRAVAIYGGAESPAITGYPANENLFTAVECAPCWMPSECPHSRKCMTAISAAAVLAAVNRIESQRGTPLPVSSFTL